MDAQDDRPTVDEIYTLLANGRRRHILRYLIREHDDSAEFDDLYDWIVERDPERESVARGEFVTELLHRHLPKMEEAAVIEYDDRSETVRYEGDPLLEDCLAPTEQRELVD